MPGPLAPMSAASLMLPGSWNGCRMTAMVSPHSRSQPWQWWWSMPRGPVACAAAAWLSRSCRRYNRPPTVQLWWSVWTPYCAPTGHRQVWVLGPPDGMGEGSWGPQSPRSRSWSLSSWALVGRISSPPLLLLVAVVWDYWKMTTASLQDLCWVLLAGPMTAWGTGCWRLVSLPGSTLLAVLHFLTGLCLGVLTHEAGQVTL